MLYYKKAAEKKLSSAHSHIGYLHEMGLGVPKNIDEAFKNYKIASDLGMRRINNWIYIYIFSILSRIIN
jgi:TPR repeat protein